MTGLTDLMNLVASNPQLALVMFIQFILGVALGYIAVKAFKYVLAFIAILALGSLLSIWSIGMTPEEVLKMLGSTVSAAKSIATLLGITTLGPVSIGFIIGAIVALMKK